MLKTLVMSAAVTIATVIAAHAMEPPTSAEACHKMLDAVVQVSDPAKLGEEVLGKLDELMDKAESQCNAGQYKEVVQTAEAIEATLKPAKN